MGNGLNGVNKINRSLRLNLRRKQKGLPPRSMRKKKVKYVDGEKIARGDGLKLSDIRPRFMKEENPTATEPRPTLKHENDEAYTVRVDRELMESIDGTDGQMTDEKGDVIGRAELKVEDDGTVTAKISLLGEEE